MMSYELKIDPKKRAGGRFIGSVRKELIKAALDEKALTGMSQQKVADKLGVNRSVINRMLRGEVNLTLRSVAELAWALGWIPEFRLRRITVRDRENCLPASAQDARVSSKGTTSVGGLSFNYSPHSANNSTANVVVAE